MTRRPWTEIEYFVLRRLYPTHPAWDIGWRIRRTTRAVEQAAKKLGLKKWPRRPPEQIEAVRRLVLDGLTDAEVGRRLGLDRREITRIRTDRLSLPRNEDAILAAHRTAAASQRKSLGLSSGGELRAWAYRKFARENGWPEDLRPRAVQILNVLADRGPQTRRQLVEALGLRWKPENCGRNNLASNDPEGSYLAHLIKRGLVISVRRYATGRPHGKANLPHLYLLSPLAIEWREQHGRGVETGRRETDHSPGLRGRGVGRKTPAGCV